MLSIIVAVSKNNIIGCNNSLLWHIPEDLKRFKKITENHSIIMGRKTFESLPKVLPNRKHIILSKNKDFKVFHKDVKVINNIDEIINNFVHCKEEIFVIGGGEIYNELINYTDKIYISRIQKNFIGDTYFPHIDSNTWKISYEEKDIFDNYSDLFFDFIIYTRV